MMMGTAASRSSKPRYLWTEADIAAKAKLARYLARDHIDRWGAVLDASFAEDLMQAAWVEALERSWPDDPRLPLVMADGIRTYLSYWWRGVHPTASERRLQTPLSIEILDVPAEMSRRTTRSVAWQAGMRLDIARIWGMAEPQARQVWVACVEAYTPSAGDGLALRRADLVRLHMTYAQMRRWRNQLRQTARTVLQGHSVTDMEA